MVEINRVWLNVDTDTNKITLFGGPRYPSVWMSNLEFDRRTYREAP